MTPGEPPTSFTIRPFRTLDEYRACVALQEEVWGPGFSERVPVAILKVSRRLGGIASGAYDEGDRLAGFVFGMTGVEDGVPVHWSDMLAVRPGLRNSGLGRRLKLHQRELLLERGVRRVYWTFDPLESRNAHLNLERLGVVCREYVEDMYGDTDSPLHRGIGTDRLVAVWELDSPRVRRLLRQTPEDRAAVGSPAGRADTTDGEPGGAEAPAEGRRPSATNEAALDQGAPAPPPGGGDDPDGDGPGDSAASHPTPGPVRLGLDTDVLTVAIPAHLQALLRDDPGLARRWRGAVREALRHYLERGWEVRGLARSGNLSRYRLVRVNGGEGALR